MAFRFSLAALVAALGGFVALSYEIVWYRAFSFTTGSLPTTFGELLAFYLCGIALGSLAARVLVRRLVDPACIARALAVLALGGALLAWAVVPVLAIVVQHTSHHWGYVATLFAAALLGGNLPLVCHLAVAADAKAGARVSYLYVANIIGSTSGSLLTGYVLLSLWPLEMVARFLVLASLVLAALVAWRRSWPAVAATAVAGAVVMLVNAAAFDAVYEKLRFKRAYVAGQRFKKVIENRHGVITLDDDGRVEGGGMYDGFINVTPFGGGDDKNTITRAFAIFAMHPAPRRMLTIGLASGAWAQVLANSPRVESLTAVEINPGYLELIASHPDVASLLHNPKVAIDIDDGRRWLLRHPEAKFDFILMNTSYFFRDHSTNLLSAEMARLMKAHLLPGGVAYYNTTGSGDVMKTGCTVFPHALRVAAFLGVSDAPLTFDAARFRASLAEATLDGRALVDPESEEGKRELDALVAKYQLNAESPPSGSLEERDSLLQRYDHSTVITDDNMVEEWREPWTNAPVGL